MSITNDGKICYGIKFGEDTEFPWDNYLGKITGDDEEGWWLNVVLKYKPSFEIFNEEGDFINGEKPCEDVIHKYYNERFKFIEDNKKFPLKLVNYCSGSFPMYILAIPESLKCANRGYPLVITESNFHNEEKWNKFLIDFCKEYSLNYESEPEWYLSSYWG